MGSLLGLLGPFPRLPLLYWWKRREKGDWARVRQETQCPGQGSGTIRARICSRGWAISLSSKGSDSILGPQGWAKPGQNFRSTRLVAKTRKGFSYFYFSVELIFLLRKQNQAFCISQPCPSQSPQDAGHRCPHPCDPHSSWAFYLISLKT